jgi:hypothetical protein
MTSIKRSVIYADTNFYIPQLKIDFTILTQRLLYLGGYLNMAMTL